MPSYEAEIPESQKKDSDIISVKAKSFADREIRYTLKATGQGAGTFNIGPSTGIGKRNMSLKNRTTFQLSNFTNLCCQIFSVTTLLILLILVATFFP